jgi:type I restriction enzyme S subunit
MSDRNAHRPGYQKTRVGWIPEEWEVEELKSLCIVYGEYGAAESAVEFSPDLPRYIRITDINDDGSLDPEVRCSVILTEDEKEKYRIMKGDILFARSGATVGKTYTHYDNSDNLVFAGYLIRFRPDPKKLSSAFLHNYTHSSRYWYWVSSTSHAGAQPNINATEYGSLPVPVPSFKEQRKIAEILSTWDRAIEQTRALIDAKQRLKRGLMQQLLTGRLRFPGFGPPAQEKGELPAGWKVKRLKHIADIIVSNVDKKTKKSEKPVLLCNYMDVYENYYISSEIDFMQATASEREVKKFRLHINDIVITKDSETSEDIAKPSIVLENVGQLLCGYHLAILRTKSSDIDAKFLAYMLGYGRIHYYFVSHANGVTRFGLTIPVIEKVKIPLPPADEQRKIAELLFGIEEEIDLLRQSIDFYKHQKKGLMQKLLSGQVRSHFLS